MRDGAAAVRRMAYLGVLAASLASIPAAAFGQSMSRQIFDTFDDNWAEWSIPPQTQLVFGNAKLRFGNQNTSLSATWQNVGVNEPGTLIAVWTEHSDGITDWPYGLCFAASSYENMYFFGISADGSFKIGKFEDAQWVDLVNWTAHDAIVQGANARNHLKVILRTNWEFYINGILVHSMPAQPVFGGNAGLFVEQLQTVNFERFLVGFYRSGVVGNEFTRKFIALVNDFKNKWANSLGEPQNDDTSWVSQIIKEWTPRDPLPDFTDQKFLDFEGMSFHATCGSYPDRVAAISDFDRLRDWINHCKTECTLCDGKETLKDGMLSQQSWFPVEGVTGEKTDWSDLLIYIAVDEPKIDGTQKDWQVSLHMNTITKK